MIATTFGVGQVVYSILWFVLFFVEIWLSISIFIDIFRSHDLAGWAKALWVLLVLLLPIIGIIAYFIFRGERCESIKCRHSSPASRSRTMRVSHATTANPQPRNSPASLT
ncbi:MAG: PLDc N-terminal domain-containing protein [Acidimicrobiales bacterium]